MCRFHIRGLLAAIALVVGVGAAQAAPITFEFTGEVTAVTSPSLRGVFSIGDPLTGSYTFESTTADTSAVVGLGFYTSAVTAFSFNIGGYAGSGTDGNIVVTLPPASALHGYRISSFSVTAPEADGQLPSSFGLSLSDFSQTALAGEALPLTAPALSDFDFASFSLGFPIGLVAGQLSSLTLRATDPTPVAVVEPGTIALFGLGLMGLVQVRRWTA